MYNIIILNNLNDKYEKNIHETDINLKLDFTRGKKYNEKLVVDWFNKIDNPTSSNTEQKNDIIDMLSFFEFSYGRYLSDVSKLFEQMDEVSEKQNKFQMESNKPKIQFEILRDDVTIKKRKLPALRDDVAEDINKLFKSKKEELEKKKQILLLRIICC
jgi:Asp-tRNA(Asn)/Glu-tRNA(Gln) amidotransferase C subunit